MAAMAFPSSVAELGPDPIAAATAVVAAGAPWACDGVRVDAASPDDLDALHALEVDAFPADEAATRDQMAARLSVAGRFFKKAILPSGRVVGFINGTCATGRTLDHDTMSTHDPAGTTLCVHSVVVATEFWRQGIALWMLGEYLRAVRSDQRAAARAAESRAAAGSGLGAGSSAAPTAAAGDTTSVVDLVLLICKENLVPLYKAAGFTLKGPSPVVHGKDTWFDMSLELEPATQLQLWLVDAFAPAVFGGNPAGVVVLPGGIASDELDAMPTEWMARVAVEMNQAETAFLHRRVDGDFNLRWFTPAAEVDLCGHATLASAHVLFTQRHVPRSQRTIRFHTRSGVLTCVQAPSGDIEMNFPADTPSAIADADEELRLRTHVSECLGLGPEQLTFVGRGKFDLLCEVVDADVFRTKLKPNIAGLGAVEARGVIVTTRGDDGYAADVVSRFFAPQVGVDEDPVTGSAHCTLASYWTPKIGARPLKAYQASKRGGRVEIELMGDRVALRGSAFVAMTATLSSAATAELDA